MNYENILNLTKQEKIYPVYLFYGKENYLKEDILKKLRNRLIDPAYRELNYKVFYGEKLSINEVINDLETPPLMSEHKLVVIKEAEKIKKNDEKRLENYFNRLSLKNNFSTLIIIYKESSPNKGLITAIKRVGKKEDVMISIGGLESVNIFKVLDSIGDKDIKNSIEGLVKLNQGNLHHLSVFAMIYRQIKLILQTKLLLAGGFNFKEVEKKLKLPYFVVEKIIKQSKKYTFKEICKSYELLNIADLELKDSQKEPKIILEELVMNIIKQGK